MRKLRIALPAVLYSFAARLHAAEYEYEGNCAESLAECGQVATSCSIIWTSDTGKTCCFGSPGAKDRFLSSTGDSVARSEAFWNDPEYWKAQVKLREAGQKQAQ